MHPGYWGLIGGTLNVGEEPRAAALREVEEELGIASSDIALESLCDVRIRRDASSEAIGVRYFVAALTLVWTN